MVVVKKSLTPDEGRHDSAMTMTVLVKYDIPELSWQSCTHMISVLLFGFNNSAALGIHD
jgi:hypothetical protein